MVCTIFPMLILLQFLYHFTIFVYFLVELLCANVPEMPYFKAISKAKISPFHTPKSESL